MSNNRVEVHVGAKTSELKKGMDDAEKIVSSGAKRIEDTGNKVKFKLDFSGIKTSLDDVTKNISNKFEDIGKSISGNLTKSFAAIGVGIAASVGTAVIGLASLTSEVGRASKELEIQARLANTTTKEFQEWAFASKSVMVEQDKLSDIMKDVNDKFGDFMQTGGGEMADFFEKIAPKVGVTAKEFQGLTGPQILEKYYQTLEKANVSQAEMTFYMESIANDATLLAPLLENNAEKLKQYSNQAHELGLIMDQDAIAKTKEFNNALGIIQQTIDGVFTRLAAQAAPALTNLANDFLGFASRSREGIDSAVTAIITTFESLLDIVQSLFGTISGIWSDLTADIGDGSIQQVGFIDLVAGAMNGFAAVAVGLKVSIEIAFAAIRAVVATVCQAINISVNTVMNVFGGFRDTIQYGLDVLSIKFQTFGNVVSNVLNFNFSAAKASWESGLSQLGSITDRYTGQMQSRLNNLKTSWNTGVSNTANAWGTAGSAIVNSATTGGQRLQNLFLKNPTVVGSAPPPTPSPTFNPGKGIGTGVKDSKGSSAKAKSDADAKARERAAEQAAKALADIRYKFATEEEKIALDLKKALSDIEKSKVTDAEKVKFRIVAEKEASDKTIALRVKEFEDIKKLKEQLIENDLLIAQRSYEIDKANIQAEFDAKKISNVQKARLEKELEDKLREIKRRGLEDRLALENQMSGISGNQGNQNQIMNNISDLDTDQKVADTKQVGVLSDAQMKDFEDKFGSLTSRMSGLWDKGIQAMMNGTLTWKNAMNAIFTELAGAFVQSMITAPMKKYAASLATRLAVKLGFIKTETAAEVAGQAAQTGAVVAGETTKTIATSTGALARLAIKAGEAIKSIMMYAWEAMAGAFKAMVSIPYIGPVLAVAAGASALALVGGLAGKIKSARGGYDIPAGVNPVTQLHEEEMVLPKQHANTIRALGKNLTSDGGIGGGGGSSEPPIYFSPVIQAWDSRDVKRFMAKHGRELFQGLKGYNRNFGR
ncbi:phage tail protein [Acinetobacter johnsonii]|uniref:phage tail protein n=1 Tax=Acinetobacter johnsonii TaxID=40214 RepID=UPI0021E4FC21|nr:phage tail protein [Acinetobacter johnsonii]MCV2452443.1 phage tail protein [Acinetobacter johnsonii]